MQRILDEELPYIILLTFFCAVNGKSKSVIYLKNKSRGVRLINEDFANVSGLSSQASHNVEVGIGPIYTECGSLLLRGTAIGVYPFRSMLQQKI